MNDMKRISPAVRKLLFLFAILIISCFLEGMANLIVLILLCLALIPVSCSLDKEEREYNEWMDDMIREQDERKNKE